MLPQQISVLGPGLLGGSIILGYRKRVPHAQIRVWGRSCRSLEGVRACGVADIASTELKDVLEGSELVVICTPIEVMKDLGAAMLPFIDESMVITDVGSLKECVERDLGGLFSGKAMWCGSHPMAGKENGGFEAACEDLFEGSKTVLTSEKNVSERGLGILRKFWECLGSSILEMPAGKHDELVAEISHFPHLLASALVAQTDEDAFPLMGPGFRDTTRVAAGDASLWKGILSENRVNVARSVEQMAENLKALHHMLMKGDLSEIEAYLEKTSAIRKRLNQENQKALQAKGNS